MPAEYLFLLGINHKTAPVAVREKISFPDGYDVPLHALRNMDGCRECYLLSTCNRLEILLVVDCEDFSTADLFRQLFGVNAESLLSCAYVYRDHEAVRHLFTVAASLDSMIVGDVQIVGQIKEAYRCAVAAGCTGPLLNRLLHKSFSVAKRVRNETGVGTSAVSVSYAAVQLAGRMLGDLADKKVLLIGAGKMAELAAEHLVAHGVRDVVIVNRTLERARLLSEKFGGVAVALAELAQQLEQVDIVISSTGAAGQILTVNDLQPVLPRRKGAPLFFIDIAVPRDIDPGIAELENIFLYDIDTLRNIVTANVAAREKEAVKAREIVEEEAGKFARWRETLEMNPTIRAMREKIEAICLYELERSVARMPELDTDSKEQMVRMVQAITAKILYDPLLYLKKGGETGHSRKKRAYTLQTVFNLNADPEGFL